MSIYLKVIALFWLLIVISSAGNSQSFDVGDVAPPSTRIEQTQIYRTGPIVFEEKYRLLVDINCRNNRLIIDVIGKGGSAVNKIQVLDDTTVSISLNSTAFIRHVRPVDFLIRKTFNIYVSLDKDTARFKAEYREGEILLKEKAESWFIEPEPILTLPDLSFWIISNEPKVLERIEEHFGKKRLANRISLEEGYYRCFPGGFIERKGKKSQCISGYVCFFTCKNEFDIERAIESAKKEGKEKVILGYMEFPR